MATVTAAEFKAIINDSVISATNAEYILDLAIDTLNLFGAELSNLGGTAGSKTVSVESREKGAIYFVARAVYYGFYKGLESVAPGGVAITSSDLMSNPAVLETVKEAARQLTEMDVSRG